MSINNEIRLRSHDLEAWLPTKHRFGVVRLERPLSMDFYDQWIDAGHQGEMTYLARHRDFKADPKSWLTFANSAIVFAIQYAKSNYVTGNPNETSAGFSPRTAMYTRYASNFNDYHDAIRSELEPVLQELQSRYPDAAFRFALDAQPVLERDLATRAGLGWVGKNTCVIDRNGGSLFFIAEILTSLETDELRIEPKDFCGTCTRCLDACPTQALVAPRILDATKCISYWTIESKKIAPKELRDKFGDWFFGCDICQTVCPWNGKVFGRETMALETNPPVPLEILTNDLREILESSNRELQRRFEKTPFSRARGFGLKRNAMVVAANRELTALRPSIEKLQTDEKLKDLAREILDQWDAVDSPAK